MSLLSPFPLAVARAKKWAAITATLPGIATLVFVAALISRLWLSRQLDPVWALPVAGIAADMVVAALCAFALVLLLRAHWTAAAVFVIVWGGVSIANTEHIYALDAPLRLENYRLAFSEVFVRGSAFNLISWQVAAMTAVVAVWMIAVLRRRTRPTNAVVVVAAIMLALSAVAAWRQATAAADWRQASPLVMMLTSQFAAATEDVASYTVVDTDGFFSNEVEAAAAASFPGKPPRPNVLVLVLEGLPGAYLRQVRRVTGVRPPIEMPKLSDIATHGLVVPDYVTHTNGTIGGLYALFCGDYAFNRREMMKPHLLPTLPLAVRPQCLPQRLREAGYQTAFMQAAPLEFMDKDAVMPAMGFADVLGAGEIATAQTDSLWGADDGALLNSALLKINELEESDEPWFLSLLTVGTHHPFLAPEEYRRRYGDPKTAAVRYLDDSLFDFVNALRAAGVDDDTLIIFTSDESHGVPGHPFGSSWGMNVVLAPGVEATTAEGVFGQVDLAASVLDYLQLGGANDGLLGRSFFRRYSQPRRLLFGDFVLVDDAVFHCRVGGDCGKYQLQGGRLFAPNYRFGGNEQSTQNAVSRLFAAASARAIHFYGRRDGGRNELVSVNDETFAGDARGMLTRDFITPSSSLINVLVELENSGDNAVITYLRLHSLDIDYAVVDKRPRLQMPLMPAKSRLTLTYAYDNLREKKESLLFGAFSRDGAGMNFKIKNIQLLAVPSTTVSESFLAVKEFSLVYRKEAQDIKADKIFNHFYESRRSEGSGNDIVLEAIRTQNGDYFIPRHYNLGTRVDFSNVNDEWNAYFLAGDWSYLEPWGVWSDGSRPSLAFYLDKIDAAANYEIRFEALPHIEPKIIPQREIEIVLNGEKLGVLTFTEQIEFGRSVVVPGSLLQSEGLNVLTFAINKPFSPVLYNRGNDFTRLGIGLISFELNRVL